MSCRRQKQEKNGFHPSPKTGKPVRLNLLHGRIFRPNREHDSEAQDHHVSFDKNQESASGEVSKFSDNPLVVERESMAIIALLWLLNSISHVLTHVKINRILAFNIMLTYYQDMAVCLGSKRLVFMFILS
jgi:hypothetical protein